MRGWQSQRTGRGVASTEFSRSDLLGLTKRICNARQAERECACAEADGLYRAMRSVFKTNIARVQPSPFDKLRAGSSGLGSNISLAGPNTVTAYLLQQIQLLVHRDRHGLAPWSATGNRLAEPTFQFGYESCRSQRAPDALRLSRSWPAKASCDPPRSSSSSPSLERTDEKAPGRIAAFAM